MAERFQAPRGTHDVLPSEQPLWFDTVVRTMEELCALYGYRRIQTPAFEDTGLFQRTSGEGSDIVQKEMYTFTDRSDRSLTLRPEGTAPICRAYVEHGMHRDPQPVKLFTIAPMYRYSAPQKGRYREHWQLSVEAIGSDDPAVDAEVIQLYRALLDRLGVTQFELRINSIGDENCRPAYLAELGSWLEAHEDRLDEEAREKWGTNPLRVFDVKSPAMRDLLTTAPTIGDALCAECQEKFDLVLSYLRAYGVEYTIEPTLVRGLDYYTRTTWEFVGPDEGAQSTLSGGGRYDGLVEEIGGPPTPGIGFGAGIERLLLALENEGVTAEPRPLDVFLVLDGAPRERVLALLADLRRQGLAADTDYAGRSLKGQMTQAGRTSAKTVVIARADEAVIRRDGRDEQVVPLEKLLGTLTAS
jgi:histidyl-tRNA synthetase